MPRPRLIRKLTFRPGVTYFKPRGIPMRELLEVELLTDELEAIKLYYVDGFDQTQSAQKMGISQPTFARTIDVACKKLADALITGKAIKLTDPTVTQIYD